MTDKEIAELARAFAYDANWEDYEDRQFNVTNYEMPFRDAKEVLTWLLRDHCIVRKSEVKNLYDNAKMLTYVSQVEHNIIGKAGIKVLESLFGAEMFNGKEEK